MLLVIIFVLCDFLVWFFFDFRSFFSMWITWFMTIMFHNYESKFEQNSTYLHVYTWFNPITIWFNSATIDKKKPCRFGSHRVILHFIRTLIVYICKHTYDAYTAKPLALWKSLYCIIKYFKCRWIHVKNYNGKEREKLAATASIENNVHASECAGGIMQCMRVCLWTGKFKQMWNRI